MGCSYSSLRDVP